MHANEACAMDVVQVIMCDLWLSRHGIWCCLGEHANKYIFDCAHHWKLWASHSKLLFEAIHAIAAVFCSSSTQLLSVVNYCKLCRKSRHSGMHVEIDACQNVIFSQSTSRYWIKDDKQRAMIASSCNASKSTVWRPRPIFWRGVL